MTDIKGIDEFDGVTVLNPLTWLKNAVARRSHS